MPPPDDAEILGVLSKNSDRLLLVLNESENIGPSERYLPWDEIRYRTPPKGLTAEEWWAAIKFSRRRMQRVIPLMDKDERPFKFALPDAVLKALEEVNRDASGQIGISDQVTNPSTRDRYLISSLIEESINSSQLEGASTTRKVAKEMLRSGRSPRDRSEQMIYNNYAAMRMVGDLRDERLTPELICEIHKIVTADTLENPDAAGRFQLPSEERVGVYAEYDDRLLHQPPPAESIPERIDRLCRFANGELDEGYMPPILRALTVHFMLGYEHPFEDGNGRTSRILFYWSMLNQRYWLMEYVAISPILKAAPSKYVKSYLHAEDDDNDLTYFYIYHLSVLQRAIAMLHEYLAVKADEVKDLRKFISAAEALFNHRQIAILEYAMKNPDATISAQSHMASHNVVYETARRDLLALESLGLLSKRKIGKSYIWTPVVDLSERLRTLKV